MAGLGLAERGVAWPWQGSGSVRQGMEHGPIVYWLGHKVLNLEIASSILRGATRDMAWRGFARLGCARQGLSRQGPASRGIGVVGHGR